MAVIAIDLVGKPITEHSQCSPFCQTVRLNSTLNSECEKCDSHGGLEAARNKEPYLYRCHFGIVDFAIPIVANDQYLGAIMAGQVRLADKEHDKLELIVGEAQRSNIEKYPELIPLYDSLATMSLDKIDSVAHMISHLVNYIVEEAALKNSLYEMNQQLTDFTKDSIKGNDDLKNKTHLYYTPNEQKSATVEDPPHSVLLKAQQHSLLSPAFKFIEENYQKKVYLNDMAYLCNISPSYFSKIFKRETGQSFPMFVNQLKLQKAKELLATTDQPIINISLDLGYEDCGYFIKVFKKHEGETPVTFRKRIRSGL
jgi:ligand-binding sensor protein/AraC-like DNA-binding protein